MSDVAHAPVVPPRTCSTSAFVLVCWIILAAAALAGVHAALEWRFLYSDGAYYLQRILEQEGFPFIEPSRRWTHLLQQLPTVVAIWSGVDSIPALIVCYGLTCYLLPLVLVGLCFLALPASKKAFVFFPLLHYLAGTTSATFVGMLEGPLAAAYFWLLLYLLLFRTGWSSWALLASLALPAVCLHEVMVLLAPVLAVAAGWRARHERHRGAAALSALLALWFLVVAAVQAYHVVHPRDPGNRSDFFQEFVQLRWLITMSGRVNVPAFLGLLASVVVVAACHPGHAGREARWAKIRGALVAGFAVVAVGSGVATVVAQRLVVPAMQFAARNHPALISLPLALWAMRSALRPSATVPWQRRQVIAVTCVLAATVLLWHVVATHRWSAYVADFRSIQASSRGLVPWVDACRSLPGNRRNNFVNMSWPWTNPSMSFLLSPGGRVTTVIANPDRGAPPVPFDPAQVRALPRSRFFDSSAYREAIGAAK